MTMPSMTPSTPPPVPDYVLKQRRHNNIGRKWLYISILMVLLSIAAFVTWLMVYDRNDNGAQFSRDISKLWGPEQTVYNPSESDDSLANLIPCVADFTADMNVTTRKRNIYSLQVYEADIDMRYQYAPSDSVIDRLQLPYIGRQGLQSMHVYIDGEPVEFSLRRGSVPMVELADSLSLKGFELRVAMNVRGSGALEFDIPNADTTNIVIKGDCKTIAYCGRSANNLINGDNSFEADWTIYNYTVANNYHVRSVESDKGMSYEAYSGEQVGVRLLNDNMRPMQRVTRAIKYAFMVILLTFMCVFYAEMRVGKDVPVFSYLLIGLALILFYSLLLSFAEHMTFWVAYLIATIMIVGLIVIYFRAIVHSNPMARLLAVMLGALYVYIFILVSISTFALLLGSLLLFFALALLMYGSLRYR